MFVILSIICWLFLAYLNSKLPRGSIGWLERGGGDGGGDPPAVPTYDQSLPSWAKSLPQDQIALIKQYLSTPLQQPAQYGQASDIYSKLANYQPQQFQYPMEAIQKALQAQQDQQYQQYQKQINPILASQGQLDSSYRTNLNSDFLRGQQAQSLGNTAQLLTNQASQNYDLSKWLPQLQGTAAQGLQSVGGAQNSINAYNQQLPLQGQQAFGNIFGQGLQLGDREYGSAQNQYQAALDQYNQKQQAHSGMLGALGTLGGAGLGALFAAPTGGLSMLGGAALGGFGGGTASTLFGGSGSSISPGTAFGIAQGPLDLSKLFNMGGGMSGFPNTNDMASSLYNFNWKK